MIVSLFIKGVLNSEQLYENFVLKDFLKIKQVFKGHEFFICPDLKKNHYDPTEVINKLGGKVFERIPPGHFPIRITANGGQDKIRMFDLLNNFVFKNRMFKTED